MTQFNEKFQVVVPAPEIRKQNKDGPSPALQLESGDLALSGRLRGATVNKEVGQMGVLEVFRNRRKATTIGAHLGFLRGKGFANCMVVTSHPAGFNDETCKVVAAEVCFNNGFGVASLHVVPGLGLVRHGRDVGEQKRPAR